MRAYMSVPKVETAPGRSLDYWREGIGSIKQWDLAAQCEREARAILRESSPETRYSSTFGPVTYYPPWSARSERGQMHAALAESLAAFCELETL